MESGLDAPPEESRHATRRYTSVAAQRPAAERVASALRAAVLRRELASGAQISQEYWAQRLSVSRAALREGLKVLTEQKALIHEEHRGYFVATFSGSEIAQLYWLRIEIERQLFLTMRVPDDDEARLFRSAIERSVAAFIDGRVEDCIDADGIFYFGLYDLSPLKFLRDEAKRLWDLSSIYRAMTTSLNVPEPDSQRNFAERRSTQLKAALSGDRYRLVESVLGERRTIIALFDDVLSPSTTSFNPMNP